MTNKLRRTSERGTALIAVLWIAVLLSVILAGAIAVARIEARTAHSRSESLKAHAAARSGLELGAQLLASGEMQSVEELATLPPISLNGYTISFSPSLESAKLDINLAGEESLQTLFEFVGMETPEAQALAARIADWRDADDLSRPNGAEENDYATARNGETIGNRSFYSVQELSQALEFPDSLLPCIAPALTVFGTEALPGAALMTSLYGSTPFTEPAQTATRLGTSGRAARAGARSALRVIAEGPGGRREDLTALFRITGSRDSAYDFITIYRTAESALKTAECDKLEGRD